jgi:hypothetical protein
LSGQGGTIAKMKRPVEKDSEDEETDTHSCTPDSTKTKMRKLQAEDSFQ